MTSKPTWQEIAAKACKHRDESIAKVQPPIPEVPTDLPLNVTEIPKRLLDPAEVEITETLPEVLLASLAAGKISATTVTNAFLRRAGLAQKLVNCITELLPERALVRAKYLDDYLAEHKKPIGPLHGLPISVKEHIGMKGLDLNAGFVGWVGQIAEEDAHILQILWEAGAVFYARTTEPQTLMHLETSNNLFGETVNPFNRKLTSGGSSGGEGALGGIGGSCMGIGTDIGGSIRSPAANNGLYGLRPTSYRLPTGGLSATMGGQEQIVAVIGPLSTSLEGIKIFTKTLIDAKPWLNEAMLLPIPWKQEKLLRPKLKIAIEWDDGVVKPHPPVIRAMKEIAEKLKGVPGIEIVDWKPYKHDLAWELIAGLYFSDGAEEEKEAIACSGEPWRPLSHFIITDNPYMKKNSITEVWRLTQQRNMYRTEYAKKWNATGTVGPDGQIEDMVDVILCPVGPGAAPPLNQSKYWGYTSQWNLLDYPALVFPVTKVDPAVDKKEEGYTPMNEHDTFNHQLYEPELYRDAPVSLQLVGRRYDDEKIIQALELIKEKTGLPFAS